MTLLTRLGDMLIRNIAEKRAPNLIVGEGDVAYLHRWWVIPKNRLFNIYLHRFMRSDDDRALHDHPWANLSILLRGRYTEHTIEAGGVNRRAERQAGQFKFRGARSAHRIELTHGECWTLFMTGPNVREWGFHCPKGWVHWEKFSAVVDGRAVTGLGCNQ